MARPSRIAAELERLRKLHAGKLKPQVVVQAAQPKSSPLHSCFDWRDTEAAYKWRLHQARQLILRVTVVYEGQSGNTIRMRPLVSLMVDRSSGYRALVDVLSNPELRAQLLQEALAELERIRQKYADLRELSSVFAEVRKVRAKTKRAAA